MTNEEKKTYGEFMTEFWNMQKKYLPPEDNVEYASALIGDADLLINRYKNTEYFSVIRKLVLGFINGIEEYEGLKKKLPS